MKKFFILLIVSALILLAGFVYFAREQQSLLLVGSFEACAEHGYPIMESYPRQCKTPDGKTFIEDIEEAPIVEEDKIIVSSPLPYAAVSSPLALVGQARGMWFFEASFPVRLFDANGKELAVIPVAAQSEWMTEDFVPFTGTLSFPPPATQTGMLVFEKDNPSGLPEHADSISIPVTFSDFSTSSQPIVVGECKPTGCSGQICSDQDIASTCEFLEEYACYQNAMCTRQQNGQCGWTQTAMLSLCIQNARN